MKRLFLLVLIILIQSCKVDQVELKQDFIGTWNNFPNGLHNEIQFYQDSVVFWDMCRRASATWELNDTSINFKYIRTPYDSDGNSWSLKYRFNSQKDSLFLTHENDSLEILVQKVNNHWNHYLKIYDLNIEVPTADPLTSLQRIKAFQFPILHIGWKNNKIITKGEQYNSKSLLESDDYALSLLRSYEETNFDTIHPVTLVVDKKVSKKSLDSIKDIIRTIGFKNLYFFQVYKLEELELNYGKINPNCIESDLDGWFWHGTYDWNGLDKK